MKKSVTSGIRLWLGWGGVLALVAVGSGVWLWLSAPDGPRPAPAPTEQVASMPTPIPDPATAEPVRIRPDLTGTDDAPHEVRPASAPAERGYLADPAPADWTESMRAELDRLESPSVPIRERLAILDDLGRRGDARSVAILKELGARNTYLNYAAIAALGQVPTEAVAVYLSEKLDHPDSRVITAAVRSLTTVEGESAFSRIVATLQANRSRPDGHQDVIRAACVDALGTLGLSAGLAPLETELDYAVADLGYEYGARVVTALGQINDPAVAPILRDYIARLERDYEAMTDNPMGRRYLREKIREAESVLFTWGGGMLY